MFVLLLLFDTSHNSEMNCMSFVLCGSGLLTLTIIVYFTTLFFVYTTLPGTEQTKKLPKNTVLTCQITLVQPRLLHFSKSLSCHFYM